ncbi:MAG TPA: M4 family metallopeptidase [Actinophytocola sp.]|jgi:hypothetical protein|uniref:M4 family metallopeptidase n=1 Tax=Actinophytocola sp. TaxID=1872138 RepID=UPI002F958304
MTVSALILAVAATIVGSIFTLYTSARISRENGRTAARLVYGELIRNSASVAFYLRVGSWPQVQLDTPVWNQRGEAIAKIRRVDAFNTIYKGYAALEALAFLAKEGAQLGDERERILSDEVAVLRDAIRVAGTTARISDEEITANLAPFDTDRPRPARSMPFQLHTSTPFIPTAILRHVADRGTAPEQESARRTIETAPAEPATTTPPLRRIVYDAQHSQNQEPATVLRREGDPPAGDQAADEIYDSIGQVHDFLWRVYELDLQNYTGPDTMAVVHFGEKFSNMFWTGTRLVVGDGDGGRLFNRFSASLDALAHELFHAVLQADTKLQFQHQAGALTEAVCDVFGVLAKQYILGQPENWLMGEGLLVHAKALRSIAAPGTAYDTAEMGSDPQVGHMRDYVRTTDDNGGIHINSGIPAHAFYRLATSVGEHAWDPAGRIWLAAVRDKRLRPTSGFATFAGATVAAARELCGDDGPEVAAVTESWETVGVRVPKTALAGAAAQ